MIYCPIDVETRSLTDIGKGTDAYMETAEPLIWTYGPEETRVWDVTLDPTFPEDLEQMIQDEQYIFVAHNAPFDRSAMNRLMRRPIPAKRWRCTRAQAYAHGYPGSLETLGALVGLPESEQKMREGHQLIQLFCVPDENGRYKANRLTHPREWEIFKLYAARDTDVLRKVFQTLPCYNYQGTNLQWWVLDQYINERGFGFDDELARSAVALLAKAKRKHNDEVTLATGGAVTAATQRDKLLKYFVSQGLLIPNLRASTLREILDQDDLSPEMRFLIELRLESAKSSGAKYTRGLGMMGKDKRIRHSIQCNGAGRTGRSSGKGFQPHNMMRPTMKAKFIINELIPAIKTKPEHVLNYPFLYGGPNEACANALRGAIMVRDPGNTLYVADWSNIEGRILAWLANETWKLDAYRAIDRGEGVDMYIQLYCRFFGTDPNTLDKDSPERQAGKVLDLACGYLGSVGAFVVMAGGLGVDLERLPPIVIPRAKADNMKRARRAWRQAFLNGEDYGLAPDVFIACHLLVQAYREANSAIYDCGRAVGNAVLNAMREPGTVHHAARSLIWRTDSYLIIQLPSGRRLFYFKPQLHAEKVKDAETGKQQERPREYITFLTARGKNFIREKAWPGMFMNNIDQGTANDVLRDASIAIHNDTWTVPTIAKYLMTLPEWERTAISLHVHDEIALDVPEGSYSLERQIQLMVSSSKWAAGCPLAAAGWVGPRYKKG